jgi:hypothetical protein
MAEPRDPTPLVSSGASSINAIRIEEETMLRRILSLIPLVALLALGLPTPSGAAVVAYRTNSRTFTICEPQGFQSTVTFSDFNVGPVRLATTTPVVVQTGVRPLSGPGIPVSLLTGATGNVGPAGEQGYRFRAFDQNGVTVAARPSPDNIPLSCYFYAYHASIPFTDAAHAAAIATVTTDVRGVASVHFSKPLAATPVSVIVTGNLPYVGPGLPLNLITMGYSAAGFSVRALDQAGAPIANHTVRLHYWATVQAATPHTRAGAAVVTPDSRGFVFIHWPGFPNGTGPESVVLTGVAPGSGPNMPVNLVAFEPFSTGVATRVLNQAGHPITSPVRIAFYATTAGVSPL